MNLIGCHLVKLDIDSLSDVIKNILHIKSISLSIDQASTATYFLSKYYSQSTNLRSFYVNLMKKPTIPDY